MKEKISGMTFANPSIPASQYGRDMGASPDRLMSCLCCGKACIKIQYPYSINYTEPNEQNLNYSYKDGDTVNPKQYHKYFTQYFMQMGYKNQKWLRCGLDYTWDGDWQY